MKKSLGILLSLLFVAFAGVARADLIPGDTGMSSQDCVGSIPISTTTFSFSVTISASTVGAATGSGSACLENMNFANNGGTADSWNSLTITTPTDSFPVGGGIDPQTQQFLGFNCQAGGPFDTCGVLATDGGQVWTFSGGTGVASAAGPCPITDALVLPCAQAGFGHVQLNFDGFNVGTYTFTASANAPTAPVPEPSSLVLLGSGIAAMIGSLRRQKK